MAGGRFSLHYVDYIIFALTVGISIGIGLYHALSGSRQNSTLKYLVGNRNMGVLPVSFSFCVTYMSSIFMLGIPAEVYRYGWTFALHVCCVLTGNLLGSWITVPLLYPLNITSSYEYLELRYKSKAVRKFGAFLGVVKNCLYMGIVLFGPGISIEAVTGFSSWGSMCVVAFASITYTTIGGFNAVIWTDVFQMFIMVLGLVAVFSKSVVDIESIRNFWDYNVDGKRFRMVPFSPNPTIRTSFWTATIGGTSFWFALSFSQQAVQRLVSMKSQTQARKVLPYSVPGFYTLLIFAVLEGFSAYAYYANKRCDPFVEGVVKNTNEILPYFVMELFSNLPGFPGIFMASLFSASLSTLSSGLNSLSAVTLNDFIRPMRSNMSDQKATWIAKVLVVVYGLVSIGIALLIMNVGGPVTQISGTMMGALLGPNCGLFILGAFFPMAQSKGAICGAVVGLGVSWWVALGGTGIKVPTLPPAPTDHCPSNGSALFNLTDALANATVSYDERAFTVLADLPYHGSGLQALYSMSYLLLPAFGLIITVLTGLIVSFLTGRSKASDVNPQYISHVVRYLYYDRQTPMGKDSSDDEDEQMEFVVQPQVNTFTSQEPWTEDLEETTQSIKR